MNSLIWLMSVRWPLWLRLLAGAGIASLAVIIRLMLPLIPGAFPFLTFYPAVVVASIIPGITPGLLTLAMSIGFGWIFGVQPHELDDLTDWNHLAGSVVFSMAGLAIIFGCAAIKNGIAELGRQRAEAAGRADLRHALLLAMRDRVGRYVKYATEILHAQRKLTTDAATTDALDSGIEHLQALARLYRRLYAPEEISDGPVDMFVQDVCRDLLNGAGRSSVHYTVRAEPVAMSPEQKVALGLIIADLATDVLEAAPGRAGSIEIWIGTVSAKCLRLVFRSSDLLDRLHVPIGPGPQERLALTNQLVQHLGGSVCERDDGRTVLVFFPI